MYMIHKYYLKIRKSLLIIKRKLINYYSFKKITMLLFDLTNKHILIFKSNIYEFEKIRKIIHYVIKNHKKATFYLFDKDIKLINIIYFNNNVNNKTIKIEKIMNSHQLLMLLDNFIFKLFH